MRIEGLLAIFIIAFMCQTGLAINPVDDGQDKDTATTHEKYIDDRMGIDRSDLTKRERKRQRRLERHNKRLRWLTDKVVDADRPNPVDFNDPVDKWLWFAIFGLGAAIILGIILSSVGALGWLVALLGVFAVTSFIVWVILKYAD